MDMLNFLKSLVSIDNDCTESKNYLDCAVRIAKEAELLGLDAKIFHAKNPPDGKIRANVFIDLNCNADKTLAISAHFDSPPAGKGWRTYPFELATKDNKVYGRGAAAKGCIAASLYALAEAKPKVNVKLAYVCDSENGGYFGLGDLARGGLMKGAHAGLILDGQRQLLTCSSGAVLGEIHCKGRAGKGAKPFAADNPIPKLVAFADELKRYEKMRNMAHSKYMTLEGKRVFGRFSLTALRAGESLDSIPAEAVAGFDLRINPEEKAQQVIREFKGVVKAASKAVHVRTKLELDVVENSYIASGKFVSRMRSLTGTREDYASWGGNDGRHLAHSASVVSFGASAAPGSQYGPNECVPLGDLVRVKEVTRRIVEEGW